jgi:hypothetical protein
MERTLPVETQQIIRLCESNWVRETVVEIVNKVEPYDRGI